MALTDPKDTLAYHSSRPLAVQRDMSEVPCKMVADAVTLYQGKHGKGDIGETVPEQQAMWFYGMNHGVALIASRRDTLEPLTAWENEFVNAYHKRLAPKAIRAFYYLLLICTREARHNQSKTKMSGQLTEKFGWEISSFFTSVSGGENTIHERFMKNPPMAPIGKYCEALCWQFYNCSWSPGYGGKAWGAVADCLHRFVNGEFSAEMMLDTIWTLSHNNGPIFNKGIFYGMYSAGLIVKLLDVQRSGQIPTACLHDTSLSKFVAEPLRQHMLELKKQFPKDIGSFVDWEVVEALGSVGKYHSEKKDQMYVHGPSPVAKVVAKATQKAKEFKDQSEFEIMPGVVVNKTKMLRIG